MEDPLQNLNPAFEAVVQTVDEAVINALISNETMVGRDDHRDRHCPMTSSSSC